MSNPVISDLLSPLHASTAMRAVMSDRARLQRMLDFEAALARAEGAVGVISATDAVVIAAACQSDRYDLPSIAAAALRSGDLPAALAADLAADVARHSDTAAHFVHWAASSQDVIDTALMLELRAAIDVLVFDIDVAVKGFTTLAGRHRRTMVVARSSLQQAQPMPFGLRVAGYAAALGRSRDRLMRLRRETLALQFGGIAGTLAPLSDRGLAVAERLAALLDLQLPEAPWHSHRDRLAEVGASFAILAGTCGKIARDVALLMQAEIGEASELRGNPAGIAAALSAAATAPHLAATLLAAQVQEHEGGLGGSQTEWVTFPALALVTSGALDAVVKIAEGLEIDIDRMRANLERSGGRIMIEAVTYALTEKLGRAEAQARVRDLIHRSDEERKPLRDVMLGDPAVKAHLSTTEIEKLFVPLTYLGSAQVFIDRLVYAAQPRTHRRPDFRPPEPKLPTAPVLQTEAPSSPAAAPATVAEPAAPAVAEPLPAPEPPVAVAAEPQPPAPPPAAAPEPTPEPLAVAAASAPVEPTPAEPAPIPEPLVHADPVASAAPSLAADTEPPELTEPQVPVLETAAAAEQQARQSEPPRSLESKPPEPAPANTETPGAWMDVLSRADAEARAERERKRS